MEFPNEKISFEQRNSAAFGNRAYTDEFPLPPGICGRRRPSHGYIQPYNSIGESISSNHDYLIVQGSIRSNSQQVEIADEFPEHIMYEGETRHHYKNKMEFNNDFDDICIYSEIGNFTKLNMTEQSDVKGFDQKEYVQRLSNNYCGKKDKETNQALKTPTCSPCKMVFVITIITILLTALGFGLYFLILKNVSEESNPSEAPSSTAQFYCLPTGKTILQLNPHQRVDLEDNRNSVLHSCEADVGFPAGNLSIEIMKSGELEFRKLNVATISTEDSKTSCEIHRKINFGILFTSDMEKAIIRCKVIHNYFPDSPPFIPIMKQFHLFQQSNVSMTLHSDQIAGLTSPRASHLHICTGFIGNLTGEISVEIQLEEDDNYQTISPSHTTETDITENCGITRVFKFWIGFTMDMCNAKIRCKVTNGLYPDVSPKYSSSETLYLVSNEFCDQNFEGTITNKHHHPTTCHRYVTCEDKGPSVQACPSSLCFSLEKDYCDFCDQVTTCP
ncbi:unnamed protein product [Mytilus coruscus]|uniref:Chitin-binding type-2 domain-containing protein n=1 Tax=Mytilus coruscus TaxID=42192 RepID=A0A6J8C6C0_MYTCO|nr:unnamed protein product [Mytilus coruscus]